jgi:hypothetical protein
MGRRSGAPRAAQQLIAKGQAQHDDVQERSWTSSFEAATLNFQIFPDYLK